MEPSKQVDKETQKKVINLFNNVPIVVNTPITNRPALGVPPPNPFAPFPAAMAKVEPKKEDVSQMSSKTGKTDTLYSTNSAFLKMGGLNNTPSERPVVPVEP